MKNSFIAFIALVSATAYSAPIEGTLMLKGSLKTKLVVNTVKSTCKLKVDKVTNLKVEDSFGNPGYQAKIEISLDGSDFERQITIKLKKELIVTNMHSAGETLQVKDLDYFNTAENVKLLITNKGRLSSVTFPYESQTITCKF